jgi:hypothetical protein
MGILFFCPYTLKPLCPGNGLVSCTPMMDSTTELPIPSEREEAVSYPLLCPVCGGLLLVLRSGLRCQRCCFAICEGCEGGMEEA